MAVLRARGQCKRLGGIVWNFAGVNSELTNKFSIFSGLTEIQSQARLVR